MSNSIGWHRPINKVLTFDEFKSEVCKLVRSCFDRNGKANRSICVDIINQEAYDKYCQNKITLIEMSNDVILDCDYWDSKGGF